MTFETLARALETDSNADDDINREFLATKHAADIAQFLDEHDADTDWRVLNLLDIGRQAEILGYLDRKQQVALARSAPRARLAAVVSEMDADDRADLFNALTEDEQEALLPALAQAEREDIRRLAAYEDGTAGAIMTSDYAVLSPDLSARQALDTLRREAPDKETIYRAYVVDADRKLLGSVRLQDLILAPFNKQIEAIMERDTRAVRVDEDQESVARKIARYDVVALPVIDTDGRIVGIVTHDDALDVITEEATEDFHKAGSVGDLAESVGRASILMLYRARVFWLVLLVFGNIFSGAGIAHFEDIIAAHMALLFFLPLLIASGGNAGSQASTLTVRAMATGEVQLGHLGHMLGREILVAGLLGLTMAMAIYGIGAWRGGLDIALVVSLAMVVIVLAGSLIGLTLPFVLTRIGLDPATASGPLVTSIADVAGVLIYFGIAQTFLF
ncbi:magnesium transporter [Pannonibacter phragmitetus]|jgi:magnesium transporter|uniref:Magnesium transporter MgtE n=1 Tax=Pannonibacter phragmitetus TaxID=121719 RepID=A0A0U3FQN8_9HYPH|nr:magnesium transporter [Pannonibacter phragmitetus]ALV28558.1 magnesium transporter [Pannonibacter phragmitetus]